MDRPNPYQAPTLIEPDSGSSTGKILLRIGAVFCWLLSALIFAINVAALLYLPSNNVIKSQPYAFIVILSTFYILPATALLLIGFAGWRYTLRPLVFGVALFVPLLVLIVIRVFFW